MTTPAQPRTPDRDSPAFAGPYAPGQPMPSDEQITAYLEMESYMARAMAHTTDGSSIEERTAIAARFVRAAVACGNLPESPDSSPPREGFTYPDSAVEAFIAPVEEGMSIQMVSADYGHDTARRAYKALVALRASRVPAQPEGEKASETKADIAAVIDKHRVWPMGGRPVVAPPAPQPEAATGERPKCPECGKRECVQSFSLHSCVCSTTMNGCGAVFTPASPPPPTVETAEGWRSKCEVLGEEDSWRVRYGFPVESYLAPIGWLDVGAWQRASHKDCYFPTESAAYAALAKAPPPPGVEPAPTVTLPLADAQGLLRLMIAAGWGPIKPAIVLREAIERVKP